MHADSFFRMGASHAVCQDYASAGQVDGVAYAILSDGCSGSPATDFGARFFVRAAEQRIRDIADGSLPAEDLVISAAQMATACRLPLACLDATLLFAASLGRGLVQVFQTGDGVIAA